MRSCLIALSLAAIGCPPPLLGGGGPMACAWPEAEKLFHQDPDWLGADNAYSVPLGPGRTLWLFGDTIIARSRAHVRAESTFVSNTVAVQTGSDPRTASMEFGWKRSRGGPPGSFFPEPLVHHRYWPGHGIRLSGGPLVVFLEDVVDTPGKDLGFASAGFALALIGNPDSPLADWKPRIIRTTPSAFDAVPATAVLRDGPFFVALAIRQKGAHAGALVRYPVASLVRGDLSRCEWWAGAARGWLAESELGPGGPAFVMDDAGAECSLHWDARAGIFVHVASYGFGASTIGVRTAAALTGPWSAPVQVYRPPESDGPRPLVYAGKAHAELAGPDAADLVVTYATNTWDFGEQFTPEGARTLYWPRFVLVRIAGLGR